MPRCADCGYLAVRDVQTRGLMETEIGVRKKWELPTILNVQKYRYEEMPICFARAVQFDEEIGSYTRDKVVVTINEERNCASFVQWQHGSTPKEHQEMENNRLLRESLEKREADDKAWRAEQDAKRREHEAQQKEADRKWQQEQKADDRKWQDSQEASRRAFQKKLSAAIAAGGALVALVSALVGAYIRGQ